MNSILGSFSFIRDLKKCIKHVIYKTNYPTCIVDFGATVSDSRLGRDIHIYEKCLVDKCVLGDYVHIYSGSVLIDSEVGLCSYVTPNCYASHVSIAKFCSIGPELRAGQGNHPLNLVSTSPVFYSASGQSGLSFVEQSIIEECHPISIGNDVWIGSRVFMRDGVKIGDGAIVAAGAVVTSDVSPYSVVGGVPAKIIRQRFSDDNIAELLRIQWWNWPLDTIRRASVLFAQEDIRKFIDWSHENIGACDNHDSMA
jgi:acetyltransferase-like isoleucine patch superfamily enzyme